MIIKHGQIDSPTGRQGYIAKIGILSDIHIGYSSWDDYSDLDEIIDQMNNSGVDFAIALGDTLDSGYSTTPELMEAQLAIFNAHFKNLRVPLFRMKGNHDAGVDRFTEFGVIKFNGLSFICIYPKYVGMNPPYEGLPSPWSNGRLTDDDITWISNALDETDGTEQIIVSHYSIHAYDGTAENPWGSGFNYPICDVVSANTIPSTLNGQTYDGHRDDLVALCASHGVKLCVTGHEHKDGLVNGLVGNSGMTDVQMTTVSHRKFDVLTVYADSYQVQQIDMDGTVSQTVTISKN